MSAAFFSFFLLGASQLWNEGSITVRTIWKCWGFHAIQSQMQSYLYGSCESVTTYFEKVARDRFVLSGLLQSSTYWMCAFMTCDTEIHPCKEKGLHGAYWEAILSLRMHAIGQSEFRMTSIHRTGQPIHFCYYAKPCDCTCPAFPYLWVLPNLQAGLRPSIATCMHVWLVWMPNKTFIIERKQESLFWERR